MFTKTESSRCITRTSSIFWLSNGTWSHFRVSSFNITRIKDLLIFRWLQIKWNTIIAPFVREVSMNKSTQPRSRDSLFSTSSLRPRAYSLEANASDESNISRALYVVLQRAVSRDCPLTGCGKIVFNQLFPKEMFYYLLNRTRTVLIGFRW